MSPRDPRAAAVIIGDEVLSGKIQDENGPFLIRALRARGVALQEVRVIGDDRHAIGDAVLTLSNQVDHVFTTGGIGPTHDDLTIEAVARAFDRDVVVHPPLEALLTARYGETLDPAKLRLAQVPADAEIILPPGEFVPTIRVHNVVVMPGVPSLMRQCFARIANSLKGRAFFSDVLWLQNVSETTIAGRLAEIQDRFKDVAIGSYPVHTDDGWRIKLTADSRDPQRLAAAMSALRTRLELG